MTRGPKTACQKSSTTLAVCCMAPSCINYSVCRGKPFALSCGKKLFWDTCKYRSELPVSLKKKCIYIYIYILGRLSFGWTWQPRRRSTFCDYCLHGRSQDVPSSTTACSVCLQYLQNKNKPHPKSMRWTKFNLFLLPRLRNEVSYFCYQKVYTAKIFCRGIFSNPFEVFFALSVEIFHTHELPSSFNARTARTLLILHTPLLFKLFELRSIVFLAGAQRVGKIAHLLCVALTLFVSANKTTAVDLCSTVIRHFNELFPSRWV
jgi:hypothetical protein